MKNTQMTRKVMAAVMATDGNTIQRFILTSDFGDQFSGSFQIGGFDRAGDVAKEETYTLKLESADTITYTPAP
jgi:predicted secreted protein